MSEGRGNSRWPNSGQVWRNRNDPGETYGGLLNVDGHQRRIRFTRNADGSFSIRIGKPLTEKRERTEARAPDYSVEPLTRTQREERARAFASETIRRTYGRK